MYIYIYIHSICFSLSLYTGSSMTQTNPSKSRPPSKSSMTQVNPDLHVDLTPDKTTIGHGRHLIRSLFQDKHA